MTDSQYVRLKRAIQSDPRTNENHSHIDATRQRLGSAIYEKDSAAYREYKSASAEWSKTAKAIEAEHARLLEIA